MSFHPFTPRTEDRRTRGMIPIRVRNMRVEQQAAGAGKASRWALLPTPGAVARVTKDGMVRGVFARPGVQSGALFAVIGTTLYRVDSAWAATIIGTITGDDDVVMDGLREDLLILADGRLFIYDGATLSSVTDANFPTGANSLCVLGQRAICEDPNSDTFAWSESLNAATWPALGFATSERQPDRVLVNVTIRGQIFSFGQSTIQPWDLGGGADETAFESLAGVVIDGVGALNAAAVAKVDDGGFFVGSDRVFYRLEGYQPVEVAHEQMQAALAALTEAQAAEVKVFAYKWRNRPFVVVRLPTAVSFQYDVRFNVFAERTSFNADLFAQCYSTSAYGYEIVAGDQSGTIWTLSDDVYADGASTQECSAMLHVGMDGATPIDAIELDAQLFGQPLSGQGAAPKLMLRAYRDGGNVLYSEREITLPAAGQYGQTIRATGFGKCGGREGFVFEIARTDPYGIAIGGAWINERRRA